jgi:IS1 family transposase
MDYSDIYCPNPECLWYRKPDQDNIQFCKHYGPEKRTLLKCSACGKTFSGRIGTIFYNRRHKEETIVQVLQCLCEGNSLSEVERITKVTRKTISEWLKAASQYVEEVSEYLIKNLHITEAQLDEFWSFVNKKQNHLTEMEKLDGKYGDCWGHVSFDPNTKMMPAHVFGKRTKKNTGKLLKNFKSKTDGQIPLFTSDEYKGYPEAILEEYHIEVEFPKTGKPGRPRNPIMLPHPDLNYVQVVKTRNNGRVVKVETKLVFGTQEKVDEILSNCTVSNSINTAFVERSNLTSRQCNKRLARKTIAFSKKKEKLEQQFNLFLGYYHFCRPHGGLTLTLDKPENKRKYQRRTPTMAAGITDHIWDVKELFYFRVPVGI